MQGNEVFEAGRVTGRQFQHMGEASLRAHAAKHLSKKEEAKAWRQLPGFPAGFTVPRRAG